LFFFFGAGLVPPNMDDKRLGFILAVLFLSGCGIILPFF